MNILRKIFTTAVLITATLCSAQSKHYIMDDGNGNVTLNGALTVGPNIIPYFPSIPATNVIMGTQVGNNTTIGTNNVIFGYQSGQTIVHSGTTWFGGNNVLMGVQAGANLTSAADNTLIGYQAGASLQGGSSTGCTPLPGQSEEDGIVTAVGENAAAALNTNTSGGCEISSAFFGQKAGASVQTSSNDTYIGVHSGTGGAGVAHSNDTVMVGRTGGGAAAATTAFDTFVGNTGGGTGGAGGTLSHDTGIGFATLQMLDGTLASQADWNTAVGDSAGCSITTGRYNTFVGAEAGGWAGNCPTNAITGSLNIAIGRESLLVAGASVSGSSNIIVGSSFATNPVITSGGGNVYISPFSGHSLGSASTMILIGSGITPGAGSTETSDIAIGTNVSIGATDGSDIAIGGSASTTGGRATAIGLNAAAHGNRSLAIGDNASASLAVGIAIGAGAIANAGVNTIEIGTGTCTAGVCLYGQKIFDTSGNSFATVFLPLTKYSAAGTAIPTCASGTAGALVVVSDATVSTPGSAYTSGGTFTVHAECTFNSTGSVFAWQIM